MFKWIDRVYKNARKKVFKNLDTGEILNLELVVDPDNILKDSETPVTAHCLNMAQQELVDDMSKTYVGTNIAAETVAGVGRINKVRGFSRQEKREGKNKLPNNATNLTVKGITFTINEDRSVTINGTATEEADLALFGKYNSTTNKIPLSGQITFGLNATNNNVQLILVKDGTQEVGRANYSNTVTVDNIFVNYAIIRVAQGATIPNQTFYPMIVEGDNLGEYEQYGAMPSPPYPAPIHCLGDDVNLYNEETATMSKYLDRNSGTTGSSDVSKVSDYIKVEANAEYVINYSKDTNTRAYVFYDEQKKYIKGDVITPPSAVKAPENAEYMRIGVNINAKDVKVQKGSVATLWSPFGYGTITNKTRNKNIFDLQKWFEKVTTSACTKTLIENGIKLDFTSGADAYCGIGVNPGYVLNESQKAQLIEVKSNTEYVIQMSSSPKCYITEFDKDFVSVKFTKLPVSYNKQEYKFTTTADTKYIALRLGIQDSNYTSYSFTDIQIEEGEVATDYVEHQEDENIIYIDKPLCGIGDVRDELNYTNKKITRRFNKVAFNGTENFYQTGLDNGILICALDVKGVKSGLNLNTHFQINLAGYYEKLDTRTNDKIYIGISVDGLVSSNANGLKLWLAEQYENGTPVEVVYELATPVIEDIDCSDKITQYDEQTTVYNTDNAEIEVSLTNNKAIAEINQNLQRIEEMISNLKVGE